MIDYLSAFTKKTIWLKPLIVFTIVAALILFGCVVFFSNDADNDVYIVPSLVCVLWSLVCWLLLSIFPHVPPPEKQKSFFSRVKTSMVRIAYYILAMIFILLSGFMTLLTVKLLNVWIVEILA